jgi:MFS transporter, UMF1 family
VNKKGEIMANEANQNSRSNDSSQSKEGDNRAAAKPDSSFAAALNPGVKKREVWAWSMFDFANSGYTTVVLTAVYNAYFVNGIAQKASWATLLLTVTLSLSYLLVMLLMPAIGRYADQRAAKKRLLFISTAACVLLTALLALPMPGQIVFAAAILCFSNVAFSICESLCASFLPEIAKPEAMGRVSGWGWSLGYFGGMLTLALCIVYITSASKAGIGASVFVPNTMLITAAIFALAALPTFFLLKERAVPQVQEATNSGGAVKAIFDSFSQLSSSWQQLRSHVDFRQLLFCASAYQAGIAVVITLSAVYAEAVMKFTQQQTMMLVFVVNVASAIGAFAFGYLQDLFGHKRMLAATLFGWLLMVGIAGLTSSVTMFWVAATIAGLCMGSSQSCGRALAGLLAPVSKSAEFFGLWAFATRLASIIGPITYGLVTFLTAGNHRLGILTTGVFFIIGLILLRPVQIERGRQAAAKV